MVHIGRSAWAAGRVPEARLSTRSSQQSWQRKWPHARVTTRGWPSEKSAVLWQSMQTGGEAGRGGAGPICSVDTACEWSGGRERGDEAAAGPVSGWAKGRGNEGGSERRGEPSYGSAGGRTNGGCQGVCGGSRGVVWVWACEIGSEVEGWAPQGMHVGSASGRRVSMGEWAWDGYGVGVPPTAGWAWHAHGSMAAAGLPRGRRSARAPSS